MTELKGKKDKKLGKNDIINGLSVLFRMFGKYRREALTFLILGIITSLANTSVPYVIGSLVDALSDPSAVRTFLGLAIPLYVVVLVIWACVQVILVFIEKHVNRESDVFGVKIWTDYIVRGLSHLLYLPLSFHKQKKIGEIFEKIIMTANNIQGITSNVLIQLSPQLLSIFVALAITFYINITLGMMLAVSLVVFILFYIKRAPALASMQRGMFEEDSRAWGDSYDFVMNTRRVKEASAEDKARSRIDHSFRNVVAGGWAKILYLWADLGFYQRMVIFFAQLAVFVYSINAILGGWMTIGELLAVNGYVAMIFGPFVIIGRTWQHVQNGIVNINETEKILMLEKENYTPEDSDKCGDIKGEVVFDNVSFNYEDEHDRLILKNISFTVRPGETVAVVGESGVGKTTLVDLLLGFHFATSGRVLIDGHDVRKFNLKKLRRSIAVVSQDIVLFNDSIKANIAFVKSDEKVDDEKLREVAKLADADRFIEEFPDKWGQLVGERGIKLSGGQRQRVAIAQAFLADPKILILDEPTSALDARSEQKLHNSLKDFMRDKTTFIIAHRFSTVRNADKIIVLKDGKIVQMGNHKELMGQEGEYKSLYELQIGPGD